MDNLKKRLKDAGLVGSFGQPMGSTISDELCWDCENGCSSCTSCSNCSNNCSVSSVNGN